MPTSNLIPCPHCGSDDITSYEYNTVGIVSCSFCGAQVHARAIGPGCKTVIEEAERRWNARVVFPNPFDEEGLCFIYRLLTQTVGYLNNEHAKAKQFQEQIEAAIKMLEFVPAQGGEVYAKKG